MTIDAPEMLRIGFLTDLVNAEELTARVAHYVDAIRMCEPNVVRSMKAQLNAIARMHDDALLSRVEYERSLATEELRDRLAAVKQKPSTVLS